MIGMFVFYKLEWISRKTIHDGFNVWLDTSYHRPSKEDSERSVLVSETGSSTLLYFSAIYWDI